MHKHLAALLLCLALAGTVCGDQIDFHFGTSPAGPLPAGFSTALAGFGHPGQWQILTDAVPPVPTDPAATNTAAVTQGVLAQTAVEPRDEHFPLCVYDGLQFRDFKFTTRFKVQSGLLEQMAGIVFRYQSASNFYVLRVSELGHNLSFYPMVNGIRTSDPILIAPNLNFAPGTWHTLAVNVEGINFNCFLDGRPVGPEIHDTLYPVGKVGFWTKSDSVSYFTDASVEYTPRVPAAQQLVDRLLEKQPRIVGVRVFAPATAGATNGLSIIASKVPEEVGQPAGDAETTALNDGTIYYGRTKETVVVTLPFRDRNGDPIAVVRFELKSFFGETQDNALTRATQLLKIMEEQVTSRDELME